MKEVKTTFRECLKENYKKLSGGQQKVAKIFFEKPELIAFTSAVNIGLEAGVSESTVIRLSQSLGYKGFAELQEIVRGELRNGRIISQHQTITNLGSDSPFYKELFKEDIRNIKRMMEMLEQKEFENAVQLISEAKKIYVIGGLSSYGIASFLAHWLNMFFQNTELLYEKETEYYTQLSQVDKDALIIPITFPRYMKKTIQLVQFMKKQGAKVLAITDSELSPVCEYSDITLFCPINTEIKIDSYTAPLSLVTSLVRTVAINNDRKVEDSLRKIEKMLHENQVFYE